MTSQTFELICRARGAVSLIVCLLVFVAGFGVAEAQVLGDTEDVSRDFQRAENVYFIGARLADFDAAGGTGQIVWDRYLRTASLNFNKIDVGLSKGKATEFPGTEYDENPALPFSISFTSPRTVRLRFNSRAASFDDKPSLMLVGEVPRDNSWKATQTDGQI